MEKSVRDVVNDGFDSLKDVAKRHINYLHGILYILSQIERHNFVITNEMKNKLVLFMDDMETKGFPYIKNWRTESEERTFNYIIKAEAYDSGSQESYRGFWIVTSKTLEEAKEKVKEALLKSNNLKEFGSFELSESGLYEMNKYFYVGAEEIIGDCDN